MDVDTIPTLRAGALVLEPQVERHAAEMFAVLTADGVHRFLDAAPPASVEALRERYRFLEARGSPDGTQRWWNWVIRDGEAAVGFVQATVFEPERAWIAYVVDPGRQRGGVATRAASAMLDHLAACGVRTALATTERDNVASIRVLEKLGFDEVTAEVAGVDPIESSEALYRRTT